MNSPEHLLLERLLSLYKFGVITLPDLRKVSPGPRHYTRDYATTYPASQADAVVLHLLRAEYSRDRETSEHDGIIYIATA